MVTDQQPLDIPDRCEYYKPNEPKEKIKRGDQCTDHKTQNSCFCIKHTNEPGVDLEVYKEISARLRHNLDGFWTRSNFFLVAQTGLFAVAAGLVASQAPRSFVISIGFVIGLLGLLQACLWLAATKLNIDYMLRWRRQMVKIDEAVDRRQHQSEVEEYAIEKLTPSKLVLWLSVSFIIGWLVLLGVFLWLVSSIK